MLHTLHYFGLNLQACRCECFFEECRCQCSCAPHWNCRPLRPPEIISCTKITRPGALRAPSNEAHILEKSTRWTLLSQRSLHNAPIFRLLLKVAVNGTHQCDFLNFCGGRGPQRKARSASARRPFPRRARRHSAHFATHRPWAR